MERKGTSGNKKLEDGFCVEQWKEKNICEVEKDVIKMHIQKITLMESADFVGVGRGSD